MPFRLCNCDLPGCRRCAHRAAVARGRLARIANEKRIGVRRAQDRPSTEAELAEEKLIMAERVLAEREENRESRRVKKLGNAKTPEEDRYDPWLRQSAWLTVIGTAFRVGEDRNNYRFRPIPRAD